MAEALLSSLDGVSVGKQERGRLSTLHKEFVLLMITLADGSYLGSVLPPPRLLAHMRTYKHTCFSSLLLSVPLTVSPCLFSLFSLRPSLSHPVCLFSSSSLRSSFIHVEIWLRRPGFQAKKTTAMPPHPSTHTLRFPCPILLPLPASRFVHTSSKKPLHQDDYLQPQFALELFMSYPPWSTRDIL